MQLIIKGKEYNFIFGFGFIREMNKRYSVTESGMSIKMGLDNVLINFFNEDVETLIEMLKVANETESPKVAINDLAEYINDNGCEVLFDEVLDELKKSEFTKKKTIKTLNKIKEREKKEAKI